MNHMISRLLHFIHWAFLAFVLIGWVLPWEMSLWLHAAMIPGLILHWRTNENRCILTELEHRFKNEEEKMFSGAGAASGAHLPMTFEIEPPRAQQGQFIKSAWERFFGHTPSDDLLSGVIYGIMGLVWAITLGQLITGARIF
jgi:hypothetical protein